MDFTQLLELINAASDPEQILSILAEKQFAITDETIEGSSVLHVLAQSRHVKEYGFPRFLEKIVAAGANLNAVDKHNKSFFVYYLERAGYSRGETLSLLLEQEQFDVNYRVENEPTFFEVLYKSNSYNLFTFLRPLFERQDFDPNQKTSKYNSILIHLIAEHAREELVLVALANDKINPEIKDSGGKTALGLLLSQNQYKKLSVIKALLNNAQSKINTLDNEGNNYLQLTILSTQHQCEDITSLLFHRKMNWAHRNNEGKSVFDLIKENKAQRSEYSNTKLLLEIIKMRPEALFERYSNGRTVLDELLLNSSDYSIRSQLGELFKLCSANGHTKPLRELIAHYFDEYQNNILSKDIIIRILTALPKEQDLIDVEYCLARAVLGDSEEVILQLEKVKSSIDVAKLTSYIQTLTPDSSPERLRALNYIQAMTFHFNSFEESTLAWEEQHLSAKAKPAIATHTKLFGHLFSLDGLIPVDSKIVDLSGSSSYDTAPFMVHLMNAYFSDCEKNKTHEEHLESIRQIRNMTVKAMRIYFLASSLNYYPKHTTGNQDVLTLAIEESQGTGVELITGWPGHAVNLIIKKDNLYRNNGGGCSTDQAIEHYKITKPEGMTTALISPILKKSNTESNKKYIQQELHGLLGLNYINPIPGAFQRVGNCSFHSLLLALKVKYRLFVADEEVADALFVNTLKFFEKFYLNEFISLYPNHPVLPQLLTRLIVQKLMPEKELELAKTLLGKYFNSEVEQGVLRTELMIERFRLITGGKSTDEFDQQLLSLDIRLSPLDVREQILSRILDDQMTKDDLNTISTWSAEDQCIQGYPLLHFPVINNNVALAAALLKQFPGSVNQTDWYDKEALCLVKSIEMIELLIANGATLTRTSYENPLDCAILANDVGLVNALLKHGANTSEYSAYYAASKDPRILKLLMKHHPKAIEQNTHDYSVGIHAAARSGHSENIHTLVYYGGLSTATSNVNGLMPLHLALARGHDESAKVLLEYPGTLFKLPHRGDSIASMTKNIDLQKKIEAVELERKSDVAAFIRFKESKPGLVEEDIDHLMLAISTNNLAIIRGCLITYPMIKVVTNSGLYSHTPLTRAIHNLVGKKGNDYEDALKIIDLLLKTPGININACMLSTEPMIFMATSIDNVDVLKLFLADPNLDLNQQDNVGYTALHDAVERGHWKCVSLLLMDERLDSTIRTKKHNKTAAELECNRYSPDNCLDKVRQHQKALEVKRDSEIASLAPH